MFGNYNNDYHENNFSVDGNQGYNSYWSDFRNNIFLGFIKEMH